jgi:surface antigen
MKIHFRVVVFAFLLTIFTNVFAMQCVEYCQQNGFPDISGNAWQWWDNSASKGYIRGSIPDIGAVLVFKNTTLPLGHVAIVASKVSGSEITVNHANWSNPPDGAIRLGQKVVDVSGGSWTKVKVNDSPTIYDTYGFIYRKESSFSSQVRSAPLSNGRVYWRTKNLTDLSCENAQSWGVEDNDKGISYETDSSICPKTCNSSSVMNDSFQWLDFFIKPTYAGLSDCAITTSSMPVGGSSAPESSGPMPVTGGTNTGTLSNLISNNSDVENASKTKVTTLHINEKGFCRMQTKNIGKKDATAFQSQCFISDGDKIDKYPTDQGKEDTKSLAKGATNTEHEDFTAPEFPGKYNLVWCTESAKQVKESNEGDNCHKEDPFTVWSNANVLTTNITIIGNKSVLLPGEMFSIDATITNNGENFGKTMLIGYYNDGTLIGTDRIQRENLKGGVSKVENLDIAIAPMTLGMHTLMVCPDYDNRNPETNETDNCKSMPYEVRLPSVYTPPIIQTNTTGDGTSVYTKTSLPFITSCAQATEPNFNAIPAIPNGDVGTVIFGNNKQRLILPVATLVQAKTSFVWGGFAAFDPSLVTRICFNSADTNWGVVASTACANTFTLQGTNWIVDIPNTPQASKGTWSFKQGTTEYWVNPSTITTLENDTDGHIRYNGWTPNTVTVVDDVSGMTLNTAFSSKVISGFWIPTGAVPNGKVFWNNDQDNYPGMPGQLSCDANGKLIASIPNVAPASTGRILLGLTDTTQFGWQTTNQWMLPVGAFIVNANGDYKLPTSASLFQKREVTYDKGQQKLTITVNSNSRMLTSFIGITNISQITKDAYFDAWIVPTGQASKLIQGTVARSQIGIWTIVFTGLPPEFGGNAYLTLTNGTKGWQSVATFAFGSGILVDVTAGDYVMPK